MISYNYEIDFEFGEQEALQWLERVIAEEKRLLGNINYIFCSDDYLHKINLDFLNHDTYTDIISFDYTVGKELHGDIYISIDRVRDNAIEYKVPFDNELSRVMVHGILHFCGYKDKSAVDQTIMRAKEDYYLGELK